MKTGFKKAILPFLTGFFLFASLTGCAKETVPMIAAVSDLNGKMIGAQQGSTACVYIQDIPDAQIRTYPKGADAVQALKNSRIDAVIIDDELAEILIKDEPSLHILPESFVEEVYSIAYSKNNTELGKSIDSALDKLKKDGTLDEIKAHWIGENADNVSYEPDKTIQRDGKIIMATNAEFPPYESISLSGNVVGIDVDIMNAVCDELGKELEIHDIQFASIFSEIEKGSVDVGVAGISVTPERKEQVAFTQSYATSKQVVIVRNEN